MPSTTNYFQNLKLQAEADANAKKAALDTALSMATQANVDKSTGRISYATDAAGSPKLGSLDVQYKEQQRQTQAGGESAGMLRSGQLARQKVNQESDYRSKILGLAEQNTAQKTAIDTETAMKVAEYQALYGKAGGSGASTASSSTTSPATNLPPITEKPSLMEPVTPQRPAYQDPSIRNRATTIAPVRPAAPKTSAKPPAKPSTPQKTTPRRIGGL